MVYGKIKYKYEFGAYELNHGGATYILICDKSRVPMFYFDSKTGKTDCASIMRCTSFLTKLILTGCCLVTQTVKVISTDLEHGPIY